MSKIEQVDQLKTTNINEKIIIDIVKDKFSSSEISKLTQYLKEIEQNKPVLSDNEKHNPNRHIIWKDDKTTSNEKITLTVHNGKLSVEELKKLSQCLRDIEQNKPTRHINIWMDVPDKTIKEMQEINDSIKPGFPIKGVIELDKIKKKWI